ncbi:MAG: hypothetical protein IKO80_08490 [Lachnospiraceae bacterium]|nr:hypothetical protein [Lachnospiraceae bacterium]
MKKKERKARELICEIGRRLYAHGGTDPMAGFCHHGGSGGCTNCPMAH